MSGEKAALQLALAEKPASAPLTIEQQLDLLGLPDEPRFRQALEKQPKRGRPEGARNRRTVEMADYLLSQYTSPLEVLARIAATPVEVLAVRLGCTKLAAQQEIRLAAIALKDHLHSKMPIAVNVTQREIHLTIVEGLPPSDEGTGLVDQIVDVVAADVTGGDDE